MTLTIQNLENQESNYINILKFIKTYDINNTLLFNCLNN
jgi:hypothetical protein